MSKSDIRQYTLEQVRALKSETDWKALKDSPPYDGEQEFDVDWSKARIGLSEPKTAVSIRLDPDVLAYFKRQGKGYQTRMNAVLRAYMEAMEKKG
ncbi:Protein of unknown function [Roseovarius azorensis]|uniref:BrnA antitoxin of type II toxin-antitoxin system n=1 Tax=Roseovarius azorensis TaxID=1287727 RepID=A0A1H7K7J2_9RHOB|nr:BrnA antitoxin family protein [Roseovarius azorensis]SEK82838.1 Protein of unknown function [Roseovarius azorensis]